MGTNEQHAYADAAERIQKVLGEPPKVAIILGSGAGGLRDALTGAKSATFSELGLPATSVVVRPGMARDTASDHLDP